MHTPPPTDNQTQLSQSESTILLASIIQSSDAAIISKDLNGVITSWNKGAEDLLGFTSREMLGTPFQQLLLTDRLDEESLILKRVINGEKVSHFKTAWKCKGGKVIEISIVMSSILDISGKLIGVSQIIRDISEQLKMERELYEQRLANKELAFLHEEKAKRAAELIVITKRLEVSLVETGRLASRIGEMRDAYTAGHERSVGRLTQAIAAELGFDQEFQDGIRIAGYLHDIGKITVPIEILVKPRRLTNNEYELVKEHVVAGYLLLNEISFPWPVANMVLEHHERLDGSGYPKGLKGDEISMGGKIMAVADVVDSMSTHRPYRPSLGIDHALAELERGCGILYEKTVVDACVKLIKVKGYQLTEA